jgi:hypothetical protein
MRKLFIFVEGHDDKLFFEKAVLPIFKGRTVALSLRMYANDKNQEVAKFIRSLKQMSDS